MANINNETLCSEAIEFNNYIEGKKKEYIDKDSIESKHKKKVYVTNYVKDLAYPTAKYVFVIEAPTKKEVRKQLPLIGSFGKKLYKDFVSKKHVTSMGEYIVSQKEPDFAVISCSNVPLVRKDSNKKEIYTNKALLEVFKEITQSDKEIGELSEVANDLEHVMYEDFKERFDYFRVSNKKVIYFVCGELAKKFMLKYNDDLLENKINMKNVHFISNISYNAINSYYEYEHSQKPLLSKEEKKLNKKPKEKKVKKTKEEKKQIKLAKKEAKQAERDALDKSNEAIIERERLEREEKRRIRREIRNEKRLNKGKNIKPIKEKKVKEQKVKKEKIKKEKIKKEKVKNNEENK